MCDYSRIQFSLVQVCDNEQASRPNLSHLENGMISSSAAMDNKETRHPSEDAACPPPILCADDCGSNGRADKKR